VFSAAKVQSVCAASFFFPCEHLPQISAAGLDIHCFCQVCIDHVPNVCCCHHYRRHYYEYYALVAGCCQQVQACSETLLQQNPPDLNWGCPLPSSRHHLSCGNCLEDMREHYQNCFVLYCVQQWHTVIWYVHTYEQFLKLSVGFRLRFNIVCVFFRFSLDCFVFVLFAFCCVRFSFFSGLVRRLRNDPSCVKWDVKR